MTTLDLIGRGLVLLAGAEGGRWIDAAHSVDNGWAAYRAGDDGDLADPAGESAAIPCALACHLGPDPFRWLRSLAIDQGGRAAGAEQGGAGN